MGLLAPEPSQGDTETSSRSLKVTSSCSNLTHETLQSESWSKVQLEGFLLINIQMSSVMSYILRLIWQSPSCLWWRLNDLSPLTPQHPYPTEDEKKQIATQTNLTLLQVNNW